MKNDQSNSKEQAQQEARDAQALKRERYIQEQTRFKRGRNRAFIIAIVLVAVLLIIAVQCGL